ncbi:MAG: hypothetical protein QOI71_3314 [Gaiellales bacterium]|nr:hypothetical protein [Gaiellales bacterium]
MGSEKPGDLGRRAPHDTARQCLTRVANEAVERMNTTDGGASRLAFRCECGDPFCLAPVEVTHEEYEAVRAYGSRFLIERNHENPESSWVLCENARFAVIDVVAGDARYHVLARNPRHAWTDALDRSPG